MLLALVGGIVGTSLGMVEAKRQEGLAEARRRDAVDQRNQADIARTAAENSSRVAQEQRRVALDAVGQLVTTVRTELGKKPDLQGLLKAVLQIAQASLDKIAQNPLVDISLNDTTRAATHDATARLHRDLGDTPTALKEFNRAADIYQAILDKAGDGPDKEVVKKNLLIVLLSLGQTSLRTGSQADARSYYDRAAQLIARLDNKTAADYRRILISLYVSMGAVMIDMKPREARENYRGASASPRRSRSRNRPRKANCRPTLVLPSRNWTGSSAASSAGCGIRNRVSNTSTKPGRSRPPWSPRSRTTRGGSGCWPGPMSGSGTCSFGRVSRKMRQGNTLPRPGCSKQSRPLTRKTWMPRPTCRGPITARDWPPTGPRGTGAAAEHSRRLSTFGRTASI